MNIAVGLSGGVDSSVSAFLLKEAGHEVIGITMAIGDENPPVTEMKKNSCFGPGEKERIEETRRFCKQTGIPFYVFNCADEYRDLVLAYFKKEYLSGRTPNPCIRCNQYIKFGVLVDAAKKSGLSFDIFSTGHYARAEGKIKSGRYLLKTARDLYKDQSYFLYRLTQDQLGSVFFPLGYYLKEQVREIAEQKGLEVHDREESQDFYGGNYAGLLDVKEKKGNIIDKNGKILGTHKGIWNYTRGQRRGLGIAAGKPLYVVDINAEKNEIIAGYEDESYNNGFVAIELNWIAFPSLEKKREVWVKLRSTQKAKKAILLPFHKTMVKVELETPQKAITPGQSAVFYDDDVVLGGGIIDKVF